MEETIRGKCNLVIHIVAIFKKHDISDSPIQQQPYYLLLHIKCVKARL